MSTSNESAVVGCLLGTAVGDALGLAAENISPRRLRRLYPDLSRYHFLFGRGMTSDDAEHACMVGQALLASGGEPAAFGRSLAWRLRGWLLGLPAGIGRATLRACLKLWVGFPPHRAGVFSAGNGPAMRSPLLGVCWGHDRARLRELVRVSTRLTHTDPKAEHGALAVAWAAFRNTDPSVPAPSAFVREVAEVLAPEAGELVGLLDRAATSAEAGQSTQEFAQAMALKRGVSGYIYHTVPVALHAWFRHGRDLRAALPDVVACGGDADTVAAIAGGVMGAGAGKEGIPPEWLARLWEWPRSVAWMERLGRALCEAGRRRPLPLFWPGLVPRNLFFLVVVIVHVLRRWLPPY